MKERHPNVILLGVMLLSLLVGGCVGSAPRHYYTLNSVRPPGSDGTAARPASNACISISVLDIPEYLDRPNIALRNAENGVRYSEYHRWAGSLQGDVLRVLADDLSTRLNYVTVLTGRRIYPVDYWIHVNIRRFDATPGRLVHLRAIWAVYAKDGRTLVLREETSVSEPVKGSDYETVVAAMSKVLATFSGELAGKLQALVLKK